MEERLFLLTCLLCLLIVTIIYPKCFATSFAFTDLVIQGGSYSEAISKNDSAQVVRRAKENKTETKNKPSSAYDQKSFDLEKESLPPGYKGHDPSKLYSDMLARYPAKSEYESTDEYNNRLLTRPTFIYAFTDTAFYKTIWSGYIKYNADTKKLRVVLDSLGSLKKTYLHPSYTVLKREAKNKRSYIGQKFFRVFKTRSVIDNAELIHWCISIVNDDSITDHACEIELTPFEAESVRHNLVALFICRPISNNSQIEPKSYVFSYQDYANSSLSKSDYMLVTYKISYVELLGIWIFDNRSGKILYKQLVKKND
jgi:hypothetical protein